jgi:hypothetical protein
MPSRPDPALRILLDQFARADGLPFAAVLTADRIAAVLRDTGAAWPADVFTPAVALWAFVSQVLCPDGSCRAAVARVAAWLVAVGRPACSAATGGYCKARQKLPEEAVRRLALEAGQALHAAAPDGWRWRGRRVLVADGTTVSMPDTPANQAEYPQPSSQAPGVGFPLARLTTVFCLACGAVVAAAVGRYRGKQSGENAMLRGLADVFRPGDVLLADRCFGGYADLVLWLRREVDVVVRLHQHRQWGRSRGRWVGPDDRIVTWPRPSRPRWMDDATYDGLPMGLLMREVRVWVRRPGFRTQVLVVATTLLDPVAYPASAIAELFRARWHAELDLRSLKVTLRLDVLRGKTPEMARKEVWAGLLGYNLLRAVGADAAATHGRPPRGISFKGTAQAVRAFAERAWAVPAAVAAGLVAGLLRAVASYRVGNRPDRVEPRRRKRRPKPYPLLTEPRAEARKRLVGSC